MVLQSVRHPAPEAVYPAPDAPHPQKRFAQGGLGEAQACAVPRLTESQRLYLVRYRGAPASLVVGPRHGGQVDVTVYSCRTGGIEVAATVPAN